MKPEPFSSDPIAPLVDRDISTLVGSLVEAMLEKLYENKHKRNFDSYGLKELKELFDEEVTELTVELKKTNWNTEMIRREAADVANICGMLVIFCNDVDNSNVIREINNEEE